MCCPKSMMKHLQVLDAQQKKENPAMHVTSNSFCFANFLWFRTDETKNEGKQQTELLTLAKTKAYGSQFDLHKIEINACKSS